MGGVRKPNPHAKNPCGDCKGWGVIFIPGEDKDFYECLACGGSGEEPMMIFPESPNVRRDDPLTSHAAADRAVKRVPTKLAVERALEVAGRPVTSDEVHRIARFELGFYCTPQRVRTVLAEENGGSWRRLSDTAMSPFGNPSHLWELIA